MIRVVIYQHRLLHYRLKLFDLLRAKLLVEGIELVLVHGAATRAEASRNDGGTLPWAVKIRNRFVTFRGKDLLWQGFPSEVRGAALVILMQENRMLTNYPWQLLGRTVGTLVALWGHGKNHQSESPNGWREKWKMLWMRRADWWFAYTAGTAKLLMDGGVDQSRITVLNNAIDVSQFVRELEAVTEQQLDEERKKLDMTAASQVAIYCGSIYPGKRIEVLLTAADLLREQLGDFHLLVLGDGPEAHWVRNAANSRPWLHVRGVRKGPDKALDYRLARVMLNPGMVGLHVVDAFAAGTPLVTQKSAKHGPEFAYLVSGVNGVVVDDDSSSVFAASVAHVFCEAGVLEFMRGNCERDAHNYTVENMAENFVEGVVRCLRVNGGLLKGSKRLPTAETKFPDR